MLDNSQFCRICFLLRDCRIWIAFNCCFNTDECKYQNRKTELYLWMPATFFLHWLVHSKPNLTWKKLFLRSHISQLDVCIKYKMITDVNIVRLFYGNRREKARLEFGKQVWQFSLHFGWCNETDCTLLGSMDGIRRINKKIFRVSHDFVSSSISLLLEFEMLWYQSYTKHTVTNGAQFFFVSYRLQFKRRTRM